MKQYIKIAVIDRDGNVLAVVDTDEILEDWNENRADQFLVDVNEVKSEDILKYARVALSPYR